MVIKLSRYLFALSLVVSLAGCLGGGGSGPAAGSANPVLSGHAAAGAPLAGATVNITCAAGSALSATTDGNGFWQVTLSGQTLPCAVQVSGGTVDGAANSTPYHSIAMVAGTVNVTPLTDLVVANLAGTATPSTWFSGLSSSPAPLTGITQTQVSTAFSNVTAALSGLSALSTHNPITTAFTPIAGDINDDMLTALSTAIASNAGGITSYTSLLNAVSTTTVAVPSVPAAFGVTALETAYTDIRAVVAPPVVVPPVVVPPVVLPAVFANHTPVDGLVTVNVANTFANGDVVTISGTTAYNGTYALSNVTPSSFDIAAVFVTAEAGVTITVVKLPSVFTNHTPVDGLVTVNAANSLVSGDVVTISGTTAYNGTYTLSNVTSASFDIPAVFATTEAGVTVAVQKRGGVVGSCGTTVTAGTAGKVILSHMASRYTGVAPLAVFFDATATTDPTVTTKPFHELEYTWDFGDTGSGTWAYGSRPGASSRNSAKGAIAGHVFETTGVYTVAVTVTDGTNTVRNQCIEIAVQSPDIIFAGTNTVCVGATVTPTAGAGGCPAGAATGANASFPSIVSTYLNTNKRILLKSGDSFGGSTTATISKNGPWTLGCFPVGSCTTKPKIRNTGTGIEVILLGSGAGVFAKDGRIMDIEISDAAVYPAVTNSSLSLNGNFDQLTLLRLNINNMKDSVHFVINPLDGLGLGNAHIWSEAFIVDSSFKDIAKGGGTHGLYVYAEKFAMLGTLIDNTSAGEHLVRADYLSKAVISDNTFRNGPTSKETIAIRGVDDGGVVDTTNTPGDAAAYFPNVLKNKPTQQIMLSANDITVDGFAGVKIGPQNANVKTFLNDVISERNIYRAPAVLGCTGNHCASVAISSYANGHTIRNEVIYFDNFRFYQGVMLEAALTGTPAANNIAMYNNSAYGSEAISALTFALVLAPGVTNGNLANNLVYAPAVTGSASMCSGCGATVAQATNSTGTASTDQIRLTSPFVGAALPDADLAHWKPAAGGYAVTTVPTVVPVWTDFLGVARPPHQLGAMAP